MRILADENFPGDAVTALRERGHDVVWIRTEAPGVSDGDVLARAQARRQEPLITKDFGGLAFRRGLPATSGIILFRLSALSPASVARPAVAALEARADWAGHFSVIEDDRIRMTPLPAREA
jgi:predicted nuclease of predicted toxin-antitoxin system